MNVWAIVPVKPLGRAKSRLSDVMEPDFRAQLAAHLLKYTVQLLLSTTGIQGVLVISRDPKALAMVRELGAQTVQESGTPELNHALLRATQALKAWGATASVIVPADLPLLTSDDVEQIVTLGRYHNAVVLAPDRHNTGTNLMLVRPPGIIPYSFGENSFAVHQQLAQEAQADLMVYRSERVALDLDTADDLRAYITLAQRLNVPLIEPVASGGFVPVHDSTADHEPA
jgi:2-phospho-L-lactate/phosphoenolpyruvate guanylyltransferase